LNFKDDNKIVLMMSVVVMAYVLSIIQGVKETKVNKPLYKKYQNGQRLLAISLFRIGLSKLKQSIWNLKKFIESLDEIFRNKPKLSTLFVQVVCKITPKCLMIPHIYALRQGTGFGHH
jgi:hypothetical protein